MKNKLLCENDLKNLIPQNSTIDLYSESEEVKNEYLTLYSIYRNYFTQYLIKKLDLKKYDDEILNNGLRFKKNDEDEMDIYQYFSCELLSYFYIRNNIYIERLTDEEKEILKRNWNKELQELFLNEEIEELIEKTYEKVIFEDPLSDGKSYLIHFGPDSSAFMAKNDSLVIGYNYDEFFTYELDDTAWERLHFEQMAYMERLIPKMKEELKDRISIPIEIFGYDSFSIKNRIE